MESGNKRHQDRFFEQSTISMTTSNFSVPHSSIESSSTSSSPTTTSSLLTSPFPPLQIRLKGFLSTQSLSTQSTLTSPAAVPEASKQLCRILGCHVVLKTPIPGYHAAEMGFFDSKTGACPLIGRTFPGSDRSWCEVGCKGQDEAKETIKEQEEGSLQEECCQASCIRQECD